MHHDVEVSDDGISPNVLEVVEMSNLGRTEVPRSLDTPPLRQVPFTNLRSLESSRTGRRAVRP